jgi:hypothetical protein
MEEVMKKHITGLFGLALLLAAASAQAQIAQTIQVAIPFPFVTAGQTMPAADYSLQITRDSGLVILSSITGKSAAQITTKDYRPKEVEKSYLRFQRYGNTWVLKEVTLGGMAQVLPMGKVERQLAQVNPSRQQTLMALVNAH